MERLPESQTNLMDIWRTLSTYRWRVLACVGAFVGLAVCVAMLTPRTWRAGMTVWLVPQTIERQQQGEFAYEADRRLAVQLENFRQVSLSDEVLAEVLTRVPPAAASDRPVDKEEQIQGLREAIEIASPKGTEFGESEIFTVRVTDRDPDRALALTRAIKEQAQARHQTLYRQKSENLVAQAAEAYSGSQASLTQSQQALRALEKQAGEDLHDLRQLTSPKPGELLLKRRLQEAQSQLQSVEAHVLERRRRVEAVKTLVADATDAGLGTLPVNALTGAVDLRPAQEQLAVLEARAARLEARYTEEHPEVQAARRERTEARRRFRSSLATFVVSLEQDLKAQSERQAFLARRGRECAERLSRLERMRLDYAAAVDAVHRAQERVGATSRRLADAREIDSRSRQAKLLLFVDEPKIEPQPTGPKRKQHVLTGLALGLLAGLGVAMLSRYSSQCVVNVEDPVGRVDGRSTGAGASSVSRPVPRMRHCC